MTSELQAGEGGTRFRTLARYRAIVREYLLKGFLWSVLAALLNQGATVVSSLLLARIVGLEQFGLYAIVLTVVMTAATIAQGGAGLVAAKFISEFRGAGGKRVGGILRLCKFLTLGTGVCGAALMFGTATFLAVSIYGNAELSTPLKIAAIAVYFQTGVAYLQGSLQGFGAFRNLSQVGLVAGISHIVLTCAGAIWGGLLGATIGLALSSACRYAIFYYALSRVIRTHGISRDEPLTSHDWQLVWRFALPAGLSGFITVPAQSIVMAILARLPGGIELVGIYAAANQIRLIALQMPTLLNSVTVSVLNNLKGKAQHGEFRNLYTTNVLATLVTAVMVVVPLAAVLPYVLATYGEAFVSRDWFAYVLLLSVLPEVLSSAMYQLVQAAGRMWQSLFWIAIPRDVSFVLLSYAGSSLVPLQGVAIAYLVAQLISVGATWLVARQPIQEAF
ncbi:oligosaccharide flippase family protein [Steroidobacter sp.]|uniref:oligosaccharide flippase family protein n=1 Tax=Steroidobacter sp. TaxID=1978227 RepID=UPI001A57B79C|nr:oligosaccharide flippase family protein [Steroidobacter sp.]MBL8269598.1 oligosaccharide flippase family protein [Steroidobacter sp.]